MRKIFILIHILLTTCFIISDTTHARQDDALVSSLVSVRQRTYTVNQRYTRHYQENHTTILTYTDGSQDFSGEQKTLSEAGRLIMPMDATRYQQQATLTADWSTGEIGYFGQRDESIHLDAEIRALASQVFFQLSDTPWQSYTDSVTDDSLTLLELNTFQPINADFITEQLGIYRNLLLVANSIEAQLPQEKDGRMNQSYLVNIDSTGVARYISWQQESGYLPADSRLSAEGVLPGSFILGNIQIDASSGEPVAETWLFHYEISLSGEFSTIENLDNALYMLDISEDVQFLEINVPLEPVTAPDGF